MQNIEIVVFLGAQRTLLKSLCYHAVLVFVIPIQAIFTQYWHVTDTQQQHILC